MGTISTQAVYAAENKGRERFAQLMENNSNYHFTEGQFDKVDAISNDSRVAWEIKDRDILAGKYLKQGYLLQKDKYDELMKYVEGYYVCFFRHGVALAWKVNDLKNIIWEEKYCTSTTAGGTYGTRREMKLCTGLKIEDAIVMRNGVMVRNRRDWASEAWQEWLLSEDRQLEEKKLIDRIKKLSQENYQLKQLNSQLGSQLLARQMLQAEANVYNGEIMNDVN